MQSSRVLRAETAFWHAFQVSWSFAIDNCPRSSGFDCVTATCLSSEMTGPSTFNQWNLFGVMTSGG